MNESLYRWSAAFPVLVLLLFLSLVLLLAGCASGASLPAEQLGAQPERTLQPGDVVKLVVWREEDMTGEFMVDQAGQVVLPRVGRWNVLEETESTLEARLVEALGEALRNPSIDVIVLRRIKVLGAVDSPGLYSLDNTMMLSDALAMAGGVASQGKRDRVEIVRGGDRYVLHVEEDLRLTELPLRSGDVLFVPERNWFLRNYPAVITGVTSLAGLVVLLVSNWGGN